jgi:UDP-hydrolysing UDP-N-acetyl-D-glucosamine 2-epimerase
MIYDAAFYRRGMGAKRRVAVFTGSRAEYGLQMPILRGMAAHPGLDYQLVVSGAHLDPEFGRTICEIDGDGFRIAAEVKVDIPSDTLQATAHAIGSVILSLSEILAALKPDLMVVYGDRFEGFAALVTATQMGIPTAHIEGGDLTEGGALDDSVRHAMTKLAHLHFTTNQQASDRIIALGEEPWRVHTVGFPMIDLIKAGEFARRDEVANLYGLDFTRAVVLFTQHSVTTEAEDAVTQIKPSLVALERLASEGVQIVATYPNNDAGGRRIIAELERFAASGVPNVQLHRSLGRRNYHGILALARDPAVRIACCGNSSSGIKETPAFGCPTVNIGSRQLSRLRADNIIDTGYDAAEIHASVRQCFDDETFRAQCRLCQNPYGSGNAGPRIAEALATVPLDRVLLRKRMTLRGEARDGCYH